MLIHAAMRFLIDEHQSDTARKSEEASMDVKVSLDRSII